MTSGSPSPISTALPLLPFPNRSTIVDEIEQAQRCAEGEYRWGWADGPYAVSKCKGCGYMPTAAHLGIRHR